MLLKYAQISLVLYLYVSLGVNLDGQVNEFCLERMEEEEVIAAGPQ
jgi:hypothetical protein